MPPEILGLNALNEDDLHFVSEVYVHLEDDLKDALRYLNPDALEFLHLQDTFEPMLRDFVTDLETDEEHKKITDHILESLRKNETSNMEEHILRAAHLRRFLG